MSYVQLLIRIRLLQELPFHSYKNQSTRNEWAKVEKLTVDTHGLITLQVEGEQQLQATVGEKDKLEVDGKAITYVQIDGKDKYEVSINDKNQLEVNGVAQTDIEVTGGEKLTFSKN